MKRNILAIEFAFLVLWSSGFIGAKYGLPHAGTFTLLFFRYLILSVVLFAWLAARGQLHFGGGTQIRQAAVMGLLAHCVWLVAVLEAINLGVAPGIVALVAALQPMVTGVVVGPILDEKVNRWQWAGLSAGFLGVVFVVADRISGIGAVAPWWAYLLPFVSTLSLTAATVYQRSLEIKSPEGFLPVINNLAVQCAATAIVLLPFALSLENMQADWNADFLFALAWLIFVVSLSAYALLILLIKKCPATRVASLLYLTPPVTMVMDYLAFGNAVTRNGMIGLAIAAVGVFWVHRGEAKRSGEQ